MTETNLLVTGDLHLGRHPGKIPEELDSEDYSPGAVWRRTVEEALRRRVDAVVVTGDVVDRENQFYEAWGPFESGLADLSDEDIPVFLVSGNHDAGVLAPFVDSMDRDNVTLLGTNGEWERAALRRNGETVLQFDGWSYPSSSVRKNPLEAYDLPEVETPLVGLLHTDLGSPGSTYAPVDEEDLLRSPADGWLLGHIHKPRLYHERPLILNPGSPQPLNPTETGPHGPWLVTVTPAGALEAEHVPLANLEYARVELDVSDVENTGAIAGRVKQSLTEMMEGRQPVNDHLDLISARISLVGRTEFYRDLADRVSELRDSLRFELNGATVCVDTLDNRTRPELNLEQLADGSGPVALLADLLLRMENGGRTDLPEELLDDTRDAMLNAHGAGTYEPLRVHGNEERPDRSQAASVLEKQARSLLDTLLAQKEDNRR